MIFGAKIVIILETKEYFTYNLVVWRIFIWSFGFVMFDFWGKCALYFSTTSSGFVSFDRMEAIQSCLCCGESLSISL